MHDNDKNSKKKNIDNSVNSNKSFNNNDDSNNSNIHDCFFLLDDISCRTNNAIKRNKLCDNGSGKSTINANLKFPNLSLTLYSMIK